LVCAYNEGKGQIADSQDNSRIIRRRKKQASCRSDYRDDEIMLAQGVIKATKP